MATRKYGIDKGAIYSTVTEAVGSSTTKGMELTIDMAKFTKFDKILVLTAIDEIRDFINRGKWLPV